MKQSIRFFPQTCTVSGLIRITRHNSSHLSRTSEWTYLPHTVSWVWMGSGGLWFWQSRVVTVGDGCPSFLWRYCRGPEEGGRRWSTLVEGHWRGYTGLQWSTTPGSVVRLLPVKVTGTRTESEFKTKSSLSVLRVVDPVVLRTVEP